MARTQQPSILSFFSKSPPPQPQPQTPSSRAAPIPPPPPPPFAPLQPPPQPSHSPGNKPASYPLPSMPTNPPTIPSPHPSATIVPATAAHIPALRRINALVLPVSYSESFYTAILDPAASGLFSYVVLWHDTDTTAPPKVIGGLICRLEPSPFDPTTGVFTNPPAKPPPRASDGHVSLALYVQSLVLLAPYRSLGLAAALVEGVRAAAARVRTDAATGTLPLRVDWLYAHVWTANEEGLAWYDRRGFARDRVVSPYYWKLEPPSAWLVKRRVTSTEEEEQQQQSGGVVGVTADVPASVTAAAANLPSFVTPTGNGAISGPPTGTGAPPSRPGPPASSLSFQNKRPDMEWNDLPSDMVVSSRSSNKDTLAPPAAPANGCSSTSSRSSSSTGRKKRDRAYPTAAFGN